MVTASSYKKLKSGLPWFKHHWGQFSDLDPESKTGFWKCWGGVTWSHRFSLRRFFFHVHGKAVHFLNIQEVLIGITTFLKPKPVSGRGHPEK